VKGKILSPNNSIPTLHTPVLIFCVNMIRLKIGFLLPWHYLSIRCLMNVRALLLLALLLLSSLPATYPSSLITFSPKVQLSIVLSPIFFKRKMDDDTKYYLFSIRYVCCIKNNLNHIFLFKFMLYSTFIHKQISCLILIICQIS